MATEMDLRNKLNFTIIEFKMRFQQPPYLTFYSQQRPNFKLTGKLLGGEQDMVATTPTPHFLLTTNRPFQSHWQAIVWRTRQGCNNPHTSLFTHNKDHISGSLASYCVENKTRLQQPPYLTFYSQHRPYFRFTGKLLCGKQDEVATTPIPHFLLTTQTIFQVHWQAIVWKTRRGCNNSHTSLFTQNTDHISGSLASYCVENKTRLQQPPYLTFYSLAIMRRTLME